MLAIGVDARHHGARSQAADGSTYWAALTAAWRAANAPAAGETATAAGHRHPFIWDTVWDLMRVMDWLEARPDVDCSRVGATGISLGGMMAWYWAAADPRVSAIAPAIGVQSFSYALQHDVWHARAGSLAPLMKAAAADLGRPLDAEVLRAVWAKIAPGIDGAFDAAATLACAAWPAANAGLAFQNKFPAQSSAANTSPRPVLVVNSAADPRCPRAGVEAAVLAARAVLGSHRDALRLYMDETVAAAPLPPEQWAAGHVVTPEMWAQIDRFMEDAVLLGMDAPRYEDPGTAGAGDADGRRGGATGGATGGAAKGGAAHDAHQAHAAHAQLGRRGTLPQWEVGRTLEAG